MFRKLWDTARLRAGGVGRVSLFFNAIQKAGGERLSDTFPLSLFHWFILNSGMHLGRYKARGHRPSRFQSRAAELSAELPVDDSSHSPPPAIDFDSVHTALISATAEARESDLCAVFEALSSFLIHRLFPLSDSLPSVASAVTAALISSADEQLLASILRFLTLLFSRETPPLGALLLESDLCPLCVRFFDSAELTAPALNLFKNISGGSAAEAAVVAAVLPLARIQANLQRNDLWQLRLCQILRNYAARGLCANELLSFFASVWRTLGEKGTEFILWGIYRLRKFLKISWVPQIIQFKLVELFNSSIGVTNPDLTITALKCVKQFVKEGGKYENVMGFLQKMHEFMETDDPLHVQIACWGAELFLRRDATLATYLIENGFAAHLLTHAANAPYDTKVDAICCLSTLLKCGLPGTIALVCDQDIIEQFLDIIESGADPELVATVLHFFHTFFTSAESVGALPTLLERFCEHGGQRVMDEWLCDDEERIARIANEFMIKCVDPYVGQ
jgi:hypothetical protein